jgi:hypothetical protein
VGMTKEKAAEILELPPGVNFDQVRTAYQNRYNILTNLRANAQFEPTDEKRYSQELELVKAAARALGYEPETVRPVETPPRRDSSGAAVPPNGQVRKMLDLGKKQVEEGRFRDAIGSFEAALKLDPQNGESRLGIEKAMAPHESTRNLTLPVVLVVAIGSVLAGWFIQELAATGSFYFFPYSIWFPYCASGALLAVIAGFLARNLAGALHQRVELLCVCGWVLGWSASVGFNMADVFLGLVPAFCFGGVVLWRASLLTWPSGVRR